MAMSSINELLNLVSSHFHNVMALELSGKDSDDRPIPGLRHPQINRRSVKTGAWDRQGGDRSQKFIMIQRLIMIRKQLSPIS
jgi:hypothetical protein